MESKFCEKIKNYCSIYFKSKFTFKKSFFFQKLGITNQWVLVVVVVVGETIDFKICIEIIFLKFKKKAKNYA
jgi:hypothetical protein